MTCAITTSFLGCIVTISLFLRCINGLDLSYISKLSYFTATLVIGCIPLLVSYQFETILKTAFPFYRYALYFIFIGAIIFFTLVLLRDILWVIGFNLNYLGSPLQKQLYIPANIATLIIATILSASALYEGIKIPPVKSIEISSPKISAPLTIAVLSDLHLNRVINPQKIKNIIAKTNQQNPDIVLLSGDIIDDTPQKIKNITDLLKNLHAPNGIFFVTGNHEIYTGYQDSVATLKALGFTLLENNGSNTRNNTYIAGIPDVFSANQHKLEIDLKRAFSQSNKNQYRILMSHTPIDFKEKNNFDLEISGHTHGGQIFPFHIFAKLSNKYLSGLYKLKNNAQIYVSNGSGQWGPQMRFLAPSEITIIKLKPQKINSPQTIPHK